MNRVSFFMFNASDFRRTGYWNARVVIIKPPTVCGLCDKRIDCLVKGVETFYLRVDWFIPDNVYYAQKPFVRAICKARSIVGFNSDHWEEFYFDDELELEWNFYCLTGLTLKDFNERVGR